MVAPAVIALIVIVVIAVLLYVITLALFIATANQLSGSDRSSLLAAGAMIGISIPFIVVGAIFGLLHFGQLYAGNKKPIYMWLFIVLSALGGTLVLIASIIGWVLGGRLSGDQKRNVQAASALSIIGGAFFVVAFIMMLIIVKQKIPEETKAKIKAAKAKGESYQYTTEDKAAIRRGVLSTLRRKQPATTSASTATGAGTTASE
jgi:hypothetical protein